MRSLVLTFVLLLTAIPPAEAQSGSQLAVPNSPAYEEAASLLRDAPARQYDFAKALLSDTFRLMAEDAGISFFGLPEGAAGADRLVTFSINSSPFSALETLAKSNGISLIYENGIWYMRPANDTELIGRIYEINYNAQELVRKNDQAAGLGGGGGGGSSSGSGNSGAASIGLSLQGAPDFFVTEPSRLLEDISAILDLQTTGRDAVFAPVASVDTVGQLSVRGLQNTPDLVVRQSADGGDGGNQAKVIWNSDSNSLYVVATRQQHQWIEGYLAAADQPQPLVAVEVKFLEINKDPRTELGIDWTGTLSGGWGGTLSGDTGVGDAINSPIDLDRVGDYTLPTAILSYDEVTLRLRALFDDRKTRTVSYPRMITLDNREVSFRSVINQPVLSSSASTSLGAGATETNSVEYVPIGTVINILPKRMNNGQVLLNISVTVSDIIGTEVINGNPFPIASSRVYTAPVTVESGYTIAISGLDASNDDQIDQGVPLLGRIPILGYAFKYKSDIRSRQHLMMLITPTLMDSRAPGVPERPTIQNPWKNQPLQSHPAATAVMPVAPDPDFREAAPVPLVRAAPVAETNSKPESEEKTKKRKGFLAGIFGRKKDAKIEEKTIAGPGESMPAAAELPEGTENEDFVEIARIGAGDSAEIPAPVPTPAATPAATPVKAPRTVADARIGMITRNNQPAAAAKPITGIRWKGNQLSGGAEAVPGAVAFLQQEFAEAEKRSDTRKFSELYAHSDRLLKYVGDLRKTEAVPVEGDLSDEWWSLVALKTKSKSLTNSRAPVLVDAVSSEAEPE